MKQPIRLCPVLYPAEGDEVAQCQHEYETIWGNGFINFVEQGDAIWGTVKGETGEWLIISPHKTLTALARWTDHVARQPYADCYQYLWHLAARGYNARVGAGLEFLALRKPENHLENFVPRVRGT